MKHIRGNMQLYLVVLLIMVSVLLLGGTSYALVQKVITGSNEYSLQTGSFLINFSDTKTLSLSNAKPVYDDIGMSSGDEFSFTITNNGDYKANYSLKIIETSDEQMEGVIRYSVDYGDGYKLENVHALVDNRYITLDKSLNVDDSDSYKLRFWLDIDASERYASQTFSAKIALEATQSKYKYASSVIDLLYEQENNDGLIKYDTGGSLYQNIGDYEYRYTGDITTNYVWFNCTDGYTKNNKCEKWRIVGSFLNKNENGLMNYHVLKIVKDDVLNENKSYNTFISETNDYSKSSIRSYLNNEYYATLSDNAKSMIMRAAFNYGDVDMTSNVSNIYNQEKINSVYDYVGLLSLSDYYYANSNENNWLIHDKDYMFINNNSKVYYFHENKTELGDMNDAYGVLPVVYLNPYVSIGNGLGTKESPYELIIKYPYELGVKTTLKLS